METDIFLELDYPFFAHQRLRGCLHQIRRYISVSYLLTYFTTGWFGGCFPFYHIFCSIFKIIHFCNNYPLHIVIYNLTFILGRIQPYFDLYLVIQGHSFSLYYTVPCTGILFHLVQFFKIPILIHLLRGRLRPVH